LSGAIFHPVNRWHRILVRVLVVAQLLAAAPLVSALPVAGQAGVSLPADSDKCPCCPDGTDSLRDCLVACTLAALALPDVQILARAAGPSLRVNAAPCAPLQSLSEPPLKPPPIR
jgi:hypothetical protein